MDVTDVTLTGVLRREVPLREPLPATASGLVEEVEKLRLRAVEAVFRLVQVLAVVPVTYNRVSASPLTVFKHTGYYSPVGVNFPVLSFEVVEHVVLPCVTKRVNTRSWLERQGR